MKEPSDLTELIHRSRRRLTFLVPAIGIVVYLLIVPRVPDLAAQTARAAMFRQTGFAVWWPGWFGGLELPTYSVIAPSVMATIGTPLTGALSAVLSIVAMHRLLRHTYRPNAGSLVFSLMVLLNLVNGRITYLVGVAFALVAMLAFERGVGWLAGVCGALSCLASPLSGLFLGIVAAAVFLSRRDLRRVALWTGGGVAAVLLALAVLFGGGGVMPAPWLEMFFGLVGCALVYVGCTDRTIRAGTVIVALVTIGTTLVPTAIGVNITRLTWMLGPVLLAATCTRSRRVTALLVALTTIFPTVDTTWQVIEGDAPSAMPGFYRPLIAELKSQAAVHPGSYGQRAEVLEPETKGAARYVSVAFPIARGWERQTDESENPLFYRPKLSSTAFQGWLQRLAVGWVAVPLHTTLDFGSLTEQQLIATHPSYLIPVWHDTNWQLYRVRDARPLAVGAKVVSVDHGRIAVRASRVGLVRLSVRWSNYLEVEPNALSLAPAFPPGACVQADGRWTALRVRKPGEYVIGSSFGVWPFTQATTQCPVEQSR